mmetsp:Transcript_12252/g.29870  ORF Transcript_12252/g.29870 Transcript_12252/m.29870 type:complete len:380 (-) Transcript_12252:561-1700(-)
MQSEFDSIREFLGKETLSHFVSEHHHDLAVLRKGKHTVGDAMQLLAKDKILSAPILDEDGEYLGAVSVPDILRGLVRNLEANLGEGYLDDLKSVSAEELDSLGNFFASKPAESALHEADLWMKGDHTTTLISVLREGFQIENTRVHHRIYVCDPAKASHVIKGQGLAPTVVNITAGSEKEGASAWVPTDVVTQLDMVGLLAEKGLSGVASSVDDLGLARTVVSTVTSDTPALVAFHHMAMDHKSAVGITDAKTNKLIGSIAVSDLRDLNISKFGLLLQPVGQLVGKVFPDARLDTTSENTSFAELVNLISTKRLHRVYVVSEEGAAQSIITLTDILRIVSGCSLPKARRSVEDLARRSMEREQAKDDDSSSSEEEEATA